MPLEINWFTYYLNKILINQHEFAWKVARNLESLVSKVAHFSYNFYLHDFIPALSGEPMGGEDSQVSTQ